MTTPTHWRVEYRSEKGGFEETTMVSTRDAAREVAAQARREDPSAFVRIIRVSTCVDP
jgi:hypothetical protein